MPCPRSHCLLHNPARLGHYFTAFYTSKLSALCPSATAAPHPRPPSVQPQAFSLCRAASCNWHSHRRASELGAVCFPLSQHPFPSPYMCPCASLRRCLTLHYPTLAPPPLTLFLKTASPRIFSPVWPASSLASSLLAPSYFHVSHLITSFAIK